MNQSFAPGVHWVAGAGRSLAEERPDEVNRLLLAFLRDVTRK